VKISRYRSIEREIASHDGGTILARWRYGRLLLVDDTATTPAGNLRHGVAEQLIADAVHAGKKLSEREIRYRLQAGRAYPSEAQIGTVCADFETWYDLRLANFPPTEAQQVAALPDETFEAYLADTRTAGAEVTTAAVLRLARGMAAPSTGVAARRAPPAAAPVVTAAAWTQGRSPGSVEADRLRVAAMVEARRRLIDLHRAEYERYLAEARDRLGLGPVVEYQRRRAS